MQYFGKNDAQSIATVIAGMPLSYKGALIQKAGITQKDGGMVYFVELENGSQDIANELIQLLEKHHTFPVIMGPNQRWEIKE